MARFPPATRWSPVLRASSLKERRFLPITGPASTMPRFKKESSGRMNGDILSITLNPHIVLQAQDHAHRIGQTKEVQVFRFCTKYTIEKKVIKKAYKKLALDALVIQQG